MSIAWFENEAFSRSIPRTVDRETLVDLLSIIIYNAERDVILDELGIQDNGNPVDLLFEYVLDAIGTPPEGYIYESQAFTRLPLHELFYGTYLIEEAWKTVPEILDALIQEATDLADQWDYRVDK